MSPHRKVESTRLDVIRYLLALCRGGFHASDRLAALSDMAAGEGDKQLAIEGLIHAIQLNPHRASLYNALSEVLAPTNGTRALSAGLCALRLAPREAKYYCNVAKTLVACDRVAEATAVYKEAIRLAPTSSDAYRELAALYGSREDLSTALHYYERSLQLSPRDIGSHVGLGKAYQLRGNWHAAAEVFSRGLRMQPQSVALHIGLGESFRHLGSFEAAAEEFRQAVANSPESVLACRLLVDTLQEGCLSEGLASSWYSLGRALEMRGALADAIEAYRTSLTNRPNHLSARMRLGSVYLTIGSWEHARREFEHVIRIQPRHVRAHHNLGCAAYALGDLHRAWKEFAWALTPQGVVSREVEQPLWDGSRLEGRTILLWVGGRLDGLGDTILLFRYVRILREFGARIILECDPLLAPLMSQSEHVDRVTTPNTPLLEFDTHAALMYLPFALRAETIPNEPYLKVDHVLVARWRQRLKQTNAKRIGIVWGGDPQSGTRRSRFVRLAQFEPLALLPNTHLVSLQMGIQAAELKSLPRGCEVESLLDESCTIADTAAVICSLDLVITVDTMVAHLAGALGCPVMTLLPCHANWKWATAVHSTPWYPTMRLFRQEREGDWDSVFLRVRTALGQAFTVDMQQGRFRFGKRPMLDRG